MTCVEGKRLLFLSGGILMCQAVQKAKQIGIYTIVTDYYTDEESSPAKKIADEKWDISWNNIDALEIKCRERHVDGVFTGFSEFCTFSARLLCDRLNLPFYATMEQIEVTRDKVKFKELCSRFNVPTVKQYKIINQCPSPDELEEYSYPVIVKPSDNAGSRGISVCFNDSEFVKGVGKALAYSENKNIIVEKYMTTDEVVVSYTIQDGVISLSCMSDTQLGRQEHGNIKLSNGWLFPSKYLKQYKETLDDKVKFMLQSIGITNGFVFISAFADADNIYLVECGYRLGGGTTYNFIAAVNEINYLEMMIRHALTGKMEGWDVTLFDKAEFDKKCCNLAIIVNPGIISELRGLEELEKLQGILSIDPFYYQGDEIPASGAMNQTLVRISFISNTAQELADRVEEIYHLVIVRDQHGCDMINSKIDAQMIAHYWGD